MKMFRLALAAVATLSFGSAYAFHSGGVAECGGCHSMHEGQDGLNGYLLKGTTPSSTCFSCHAQPDTAPSSYHIYSLNVAVGSPPVERTPGGDFAWLLKDYSFQARTSEPVEYITGQSHGHNVVAPDYGIAADTELTTAPGGTYPATSLGCNSCHDPHGRMRRMADSNVTWATTGAPIVSSGSYNNSPAATATAAVGMYRILRGTINVDSGLPFVPNYRGNFMAVAPSSYNRSEAVTQTRVAYASDGATASDTVGMWCGSCHPDMHSNLNTSRLVHPIDANLGAYATNYGQYVSSGIMTGNPASSYLSLVPFAENTGNFATLRSHARNNDSQLGGPASTDKVMCLSCHRAHATGFPDMLRWNYEGAEFITALNTTSNTVVWPGTDVPGSKGQIGMTSAEQSAAYNDYPAAKFGNYQRQLCNKCHAKD